MQSKPGSRWLFAATILVLTLFAGGIWLALEQSNAACIRAAEAETRVRAVEKEAETRFDVQEKYIVKQLDQIREDVQEVRRVLDQVLRNGKRTSNP